MKNKKWIDVAISKEFIEYFNTEELIELSLCSKLFRSKLIRVIYKTLKLNCSKMNKFGYKSYVITEEDSEYNDKYIQDRKEGLVQDYISRYLEIDHEGPGFPVNFFTNPYKPLTEKFIASREKLQSNLKIIPYQPSVFIIDNFYNHCYLIKELPTTFNNLKALHIDCIWVTLEDLQCLLDSLKYLEDLKCINNYIFKCKLESVSSYINWPQNLIKLTIGSNEEVILDNKDDPIPLDPYEDDLDIPTIQHLLLPTHLPNLKSLSLKHWKGKFDDKLEFLKVNTHITKLSLPFVEEIHEVFNIIQSFNNLEHLYIFKNNCNYPKALEIINSPIPSNLNSLTLSIYWYTDIVPFLNKSFLQITNLKVKFNSIHIKGLLLFIKKLPDMQLLKNLKLQFQLTPYESDEIKRYTVNNPIRTDVIKFPKLETLESVEFKLVINFAPYAKMDLSQLKLRVDNCPKLKCIGFRSDTKLKCFGEIGSGKLGLGDNWKLISTPRRYLLDKVNQ